VFEALSRRFSEVFKNLRARGILTKDVVQDTLRQIRITLLEADVNYKVVRQFISRIEEEIQREDITRSINPAQRVFQIVYKNIAELMRGEPFRLRGAIPHTLVLMGLQGSGKTTMCAKLAHYFKKDGKKVLLAPCDVHRAAAGEQLETLASKVGVEVYPQRESALSTAKGAFRRAQEAGFDIVILDTAGRLHIDEEMMAELEMIRHNIPGTYILVLDAMTGQEAVRVAEEFHSRIGIDGVALTKLDGDARGGAALSIVATCGVPIYFAGVGERVEDIELFEPERMAGRILGMGDVQALEERVQEVVSEEEAKQLAEKIKTSELTLEDLLTQIQHLKKMGPLSKILGMLPGAGQYAEMIDPKELKRAEAIILSMTPEERRNPGIIDGSRKRRIARGSGTTVQDVNRLLKQFQQMKRFLKDAGKLAKSKRVAKFLGGGA